MNEDEALVTEVPIPERAQRRMAELDRQVKQTQQMFNLYMEALVDGLGLEGTWSFSPDGTKFVKIPPPEPPPEE